MPTDPAVIFDPPAFSGAAPAVLPTAVTLAPVDVGTVTPAPAAPGSPAVPPAPAAGTPQDIGTVYTPPAAPGSPAVPPAPAAGTPQDVGTVYTPPAAVAHASLSVGNGTSAILFTAVATGASGNTISIQCAAAVDSAVTAVTVTGTAILITPASKARMSISGLTSENIFTHVENPFEGNGEYAILDNYNGRPRYKDQPGSHQIIWNSDGSGGFQWVLTTTTSPISVTLAYATGDVMTPDLATSWHRPGITESFAVTPLVSSTNQAVSAINASDPASALVTAVCVGDGTGSVAPLAATHLDGGTISPAVIWTP